jgi:hypothetical protein
MLRLLWASDARQVDFGYALARVPSLALNEGGAFMKKRKHRESHWPQDRWLVAKEQLERRYQSRLFPSATRVAGMPRDFPLPSSLSGIGTPTYMVTLAEIDRLREGLIGCAVLLERTRAWIRGTAGRSSMR